MAEQKPVTDWERIERDYRAGVKTLRQIGEENGVSHVAINKRAKRDGWSRDLSAKIHAKADELVTKASVTKTVTAEQRVTERELVDANAQAITAVRLGHRRDIQRSRGIVMSMLAELEAACSAEHVAMLEQLGDVMRSPDQYGRDKLNDLYQAVISLPGRSKTMKDLTASLAVLIDKERQAFGLDNGQAADDRPRPSVDAGALSDAALAELMNARRRSTASTE